MRRAAGTRTRAALNTTWREREKALEGAMKLMEWSRLLSRKRLHRPAEKPIVDNNAFEEDQDRICYSQPFRRLQAIELY